MSEQSLADLCKPLSAKIMPKRMLYNSDHTERTQEEAQERSRLSDVVRVWRKMEARKRLQNTLTGG